MRGITNAVVYSGGGGSGDVVFAVNNTGEEVVAANKQVYLVRQMNFETNSGQHLVIIIQPIVRRWPDILRTIILLLQKICGIIMKTATVGTRWNFQI